MARRASEAPCNRIWFLQPNLGNVILHLFEVAADADAVDWTTVTLFDRDHLHAAGRQGGTIQAAIRKSQLPPSEKNGRPNYRNDRHQRKGHCKVAEPQYRVSRQSRARQQVVKSSGLLFQYHAHPQPFKFGFSVYLAELFQRRLPAFVWKHLAMGEGKL